DLLVEAIDCVGRFDEMRFGLLQRFPVAVDLAGLRLGLEGAAAREDRQENDGAQSGDHDATSSSPRANWLTSCETRGRFIPSSWAAWVMLPFASASARSMQVRSSSFFISGRLRPERTAS